MAALSCPHSHFLQPMPIQRCYSDGLCLSMLQCQQLRLIGPYPVSFRRKCEILLIEIFQTILKLLWRLLIIISRVIGDSSIILPDKLHQLNKPISGGSSIALQIVKWLLTIICNYLVELC